MSKWVVILHDAIDATPEGRLNLEHHFVQSLGMNAEAAKSVFSSLPVMIRRDLSKEKAERFVSLLEQLGAISEMIEYEGSLKIPDLGLEMPSETAAQSEPSAEPSPEFSSNQSEMSLDGLERMLDHALHAPESELEQAQHKQEKMDDKSEDSFALSFEIDSIESSQKERGVAALLDTPLDEFVGHLPEAENITEVVLNEADISPTTEPRATDESTSYREEVGRNDVGIYHGAFGENKSESKCEVPARDYHLHSPIEDSLESPLWKYKKHSKALIAFGVLILAAIIGFPFLSRPSQGVLISFDLESLLKQQSEILSSTDSPTKIPIWTRRLWTSESTQNGVSSKLILLEVDGKIVQAGLEISSEKPPARTPQEIVNKVKPPVWMRRAVAKGITPHFVLAYPEGDNTFSLNGVSRTYLSDEISSERIIVPLTLTAYWDKEQGRWKGEFTLDRNAQEIPDNQSNKNKLHVERLQGNNFAVFYSQKFESIPMGEGQAN